MCVFATEHTEATEGDGFTAWVASTDALSSLFNADCTTANARYAICNVSPIKLPAPEHHLQPQATSRPRGHSLRRFQPTRPVFAGSNSRNEAVQRRGRVLSRTPPGPQCGQRLRPVLQDGSHRHGNSQGPRSARLLVPHARIGRPRPQSELLQHGPQHKSEEPGSFVVRSGRAAAEVFEIPGKRPTTLAPATTLRLLPRDVSALGEPSRGVPRPTERMSSDYRGADLHAVRTRRPLSSHGGRRRRLWTGLCVQSCGSAESQKVGRADGAVGRHAVSCLLPARCRLSPVLGEAWPVRCEAQG